MIINANEFAGLHEITNLKGVPEFQQGKAVALPSHLATPEAAAEHLKGLPGSQFKDAQGVHFSKNEQGDTIATPVLSPKQLWNGEVNAKGEKGTKLQAGWAGTKRGMAMLTGAAVNHPVAAVIGGATVITGSALAAQAGKQNAQSQGFQQGAQAAQAALQQRAY